MTIRQLLNKYNDDSLVYLFVDNNLQGQMFKDKFMKVYKDYMPIKNFTFSIHKPRGYSDPVGLEIHLKI